MAVDSGSREAGTGRVGGLGSVLRKRHSRRGPSAHQRSRIAPVSRPGVPGWGGRGREEGSGCLVHRIHCDSDPGVSVEPKGSRVAPVQVGLYRGGVQRGLGYKSRQVQSLR